MFAGAAPRFEAGDNRKTLTSPVAYLGIAQLSLLQTKLNNISLCDSCGVTETVLNKLHK